MSIHALNWAFEQQVGPSSTKFILVCMANYANESFEAYPSIATICRLTSLDRKTVITGLARLVRRGFIADTGRRVGATRTIPVYKFNSAKNGTIPKTEQSQNSVEAVPFFPTSSPVFPHKQSQKRDTDPSGNHQEPVPNPQTVRASVSRRPVSVEEVIEKGKFIGLDEQSCRDWFRDCEACGWTRGDGSPFDNWPRQLVIHRDHIAENRVKGNGQGSGRPATIMDLKAIIQVKEEKAKALRDKFSTDGPLSVDWRDQTKRQEWSALRTEIKGLKERIEKMA